MSTTQRLDVTGKEINVGDKVVIALSGTTTLTQVRVISFSKRLVWMERITGSETFKRYSNQVVLVEKCNDL